MNSRIYAAPAVKGLRRFQIEETLWSLGLRKKYFSTLTVKSENDLINKKSQFVYQRWHTTVISEYTIAKKHN